MANIEKYRVYSDVEWLFPDTEITEYQNKAELYSARGADVDFQLLCDAEVKCGDSFSVVADGLCGEVVVYQLGIAHVSENSAPKSLTTKNYDEVSDFVIRKAPYDIYDVTYELDGKIARCGRAAFFIRVNIAADEAPGVYDGSITLNVGENQIVIPVSLKVYETVIPTLEETEFHMVNWLYYPLIAEQHGVEPYSEDYRRLLGQYMKNQLDMRTDYLMIPSGEPVRDADGKVIDFDFSHAEYVGRMAIYYGFNCIMGGFVARFKNWDDPDHMLLWDREVGVTTNEGFRQLKLYFTRALECVEKNGWESRYMQCLVDEPQFPNSRAYQALSGICRQMMPGVLINDPVETCDIQGACDVYVVKQAVYEKHYEKFRELQDYGEEMWLYTCGFPAGKTMNRVMDLPLTVSRLPMWLCYKYDCPGFLHWGYHYLNKPDENGIVDGCYDIGGGHKYPGGNGHVVYTGENGPVYAVRGHAQRTGAIDYELFNILGKSDVAKAKALIEKVAQSFDDYDGSAALFDEVRHELLEILG